MGSPKNLWIWGFLLLGVAFIVSALFLLGPKNEPATKPVWVLARAEKLTGTASVQRDGSLARETLASRANVGPLDSVETGDLGEVMLDFESGFRVRLKEHSLVTLERVEDQHGFHVVLILKRGHIQMESFGREGDLFIGKNGERISATDYQDSPLAQAPVQETATDRADGRAAPVHNDDSLGEAEIQSVMNSHRTSFLKCYTQLLQKDPHAKGDLTLNFTIENSGKMSAIDVNSNTLTQTDFKKCLIDVMSRIEFRPFSGAPVSTLFPLKFE